MREKNIKSKESDQIKCKTDSSTVLNIGEIHTLGRFSTMLTKEDNLATFCWPYFISNLVEKGSNPLSWEKFFSFIVGIH